MEDQIHRFPEVENLERRIVDISKPENSLNNIDKPNFILFPTSSIFTLKDTRFKSAHGGVIGYHVASKDRCYVLGQYHKPLCVAHLSKSLLDPMMSILDMDKIEEISIRGIPILYSPIYKLELMNPQDRERVERLSVVPNYFPS